jgi:hypothetical protein
MEWQVPYLEAVLAFICAANAFHTYLDVRQLKVARPGCAIHEHR